MATPFSPLFKRSSKAIRKAARQEFNNSDIGKLVKEVRKVTGGRAKKSDNDKFYRSLNKLSKSGTLQQLARRSEVGQIAGGIQRYGMAESLKGQLLGELFGSLGPLGELMQGLLRPRGKPVAKTIDQELGAASSLIRAFGGFATLPGDRKANKQMIKYLEDQGYTITKPVRQRGQMPTTPPRVIPPTTRGKRRTTIDVEVGGAKRRFRITDPIVTGEMILVTSDSVHSIGFDMDPANATLGTLKIRFVHKTRKGFGAPGSLYYYYHVPTTVFEAFRKAGSKGAWVWDNVRYRGSVSGHRYDYRLAGITRGYVPRKATMMGREEWFVRRQFSGRSTKTGEERIFESGGDMMVRRGLPNRGRANGGDPNRAPPNRG